MSPAAIVLGEHLILLLYYRGLSTTRASHATLAELAFPATAVALDWILPGAGVTVGQVVGFFVLWVAIYGLARVDLRERRQDDETEGKG